VHVVLIHLLGFEVHAMMVHIKVNHLNTPAQPTNVTFSISIHKVPKQVMYVSSR